jgi:plasmid stabilization system protein ParE
MNLRFLETAKTEFWEAAAYYEQEREGLGGEFAREISKAIDRIVDHPNAWRPLSPRTRQCRSRRFPYAVVYQVKSDHIIVVAIALTS